MLERYGVEYPMQSAELQEKYKKTCLNKYGVEYPIQKQIVNRPRASAGACNTGSWD